MIERCRAENGREEQGCAGHVDRSRAGQGMRERMAGIIERSWTGYGREV